MSCYSGPDEVTNGLVFQYDMGNTKKSWKGAPTTNYYNTSPNFYNWNGQDIVVSNTTPEIQKIYSTSRVGFNAIRSVNFGTANSTTLLSYSLEVRGIGNCYLQVHQANVAINGGQTAVNSSSITLSNEWQRIQVQYYLASTITAQNVLVILDAGVNNYVEVRYPQVEFNPFATPYTTTSRSTTQAILDLTGNNTVTASSLTYNTDGTFNYNGSSNYLDCGNSSVLQQSSAITMSAWVKPTSTTTLGNIMAKNANSGYRFRIDSTANALWWYVSGNAIMGGSCPNGVWSHCTVTGSQTGLSVYVNGVLVASNSTPFAPSAPTVGNLYVGMLGGAEYFNGSINVATMYNRALSAAEVAQNFNSMRSRFGV